MLSCHVIIQVLPQRMYRKYIWEMSLLLGKDKLQRDRWHLVQVLTSLKITNVLVN